MMNHGPAAGAVGDLTAGIDGRDVTREG